MFTTCGLGVAVRFQNQTMFTIKQHLYNDTSNPSICIQYYLLEINFHKGTYSQHVETLTVGEDFFSVVEIPAVVNGVYAFAVVRQKNKASIAERARIMQLA